MVTSELKPSMFWLPLTPITVTGALKVLMSSRARDGTWISKSVSTTLSLRRSTTRWLASTSMVLPLVVISSLMSSSRSPRGAADGVNHDLIAGPAGDLDAAREGLQPQRPALAGSGTVRSIGCGPGRGPRVVAVALAGWGGTRARSWRPVGPLGPGGDAAAGH